MPISHERFAHMLMSLLAHIHHLQGLDRGAALDEETAGEIADALYKLRAIYCEEALRHMLPNRRAKASKLQDAANAQALVDFYGMDAASAMEAITGNPDRVERHSLARTLRNRRRMVELMGVAPDWKVIHAAAKRKKKAER
jgi:hypothetical protein